MWFFSGLDEELFLGPKGARMLTVKQSWNFSKCGLVGSGGSKTEARFRQVTGSGLREPLYRFGQHYIKGMVTLRAFDLLNAAGTLGSLANWKRVTVRALDKGNAGRHLYSWALFCLRVRLTACSANLICE
jgi:hypothetical protein